MFRTKELTPTPYDLRACPKCKGGLMVVTEHIALHAGTFVGSVNTGDAKQVFRCRTCGHRKRLNSEFLYPSKIWRGTEIFLGIMGAITLVGFPMAIASFYAIPKYRSHLNRSYPRLGTTADLHGHAPNSAAPLFLEVPHRRRCKKCGEIVAPKTVHSSTNGVPTGTEYTYTCTCGHVFVLENWLAVFWMVVAFGIAAALTYFWGPWWLLMSVPVAVGLLIMTPYRILQRYQNPLV